MTVPAGWIAERPSQWASRTESPGTCEGGHAEPAIARISRVRCRAVAFTASTQCGNSAPTATGGPQSAPAAQQEHHRRTRPRPPQGTRRVTRDPLAGAEGRHPAELNRRSPEGVPISLYRAFIARADQLGRHRSGPPLGDRNTHSSPSAPVSPWARMCSAMTSQTTSGTGRRRRPAAVFGAPMWNTPFASRPTALS